MKSARQKERESSDLLKLISDRTPSMVAYFTPDLCYRFVNKSYEDRMGKPLSYFIGRPVSDVLGEKFLERAMPYMKRVLAGETVNFQNSGNIKGEPIELDTTYTPDVDENGKVRGFIVMAHDITKEKTIQKELEHAKSAAEEASLAKSQFLANMSHELRTPLGVITGFLNMMGDAGPVERAQFSEVINRNSQHLVRIIDDILDLSKIEAGKISIEKTKFNLSQFLSEIESSFVHRCEQKKIEYRRRMEGQIPEAIETDPARLRQVLLNVLGNAIKFTDQGFVEMSVSYQEPSLIFRIHDSGPGLSREQASHLFEPFSQADNSVTRRYGGTGLGLALSRRLCRALDGDLRLTESEVGVGSVFEAKVHVLKADLSEAVAHPRAAAAIKGALSERPLSGAKILFVDDSADNQVLISHFLRGAGADVQLASNGQEGVEKARAQKFNLILMDIQMPVLDGLSATQILRSEGFSLPIVALTAHAMAEERTRSLQAGCSDHLSKPVSRDQLINVVSKLMGNA